MSYHERLLRYQNAPSTGGVFAVLDSAQFDDVRPILDRENLTFFPLYVNETTASDPPTGPILVATSSQQEIIKLLTVAEGRPCLVWWIWPGGSAEQTSDPHKHLRSLGRVEIPRERGDRYADEDQLETRAPDAPQSEYDVVLFRHADPRVVGRLLPLFSPEQSRRFFGPAHAVLVDPSYSDGVIEFRPKGAGPTPAGFLRITPAQYETLLQEDHKESRARIVDYLRGAAPDETAGQSDADLYNFVAGTEAEAERLGLLSEQSYGLWAFLTLITGGSLIGRPEIDNYFAERDDPDDALNDLFEDIINADDDEIEGFIP
ncbi:MAG: DUF4123 domain-containing protein [Maricaulaceae bacterium]